MTFAFAQEILPRLQDNQAASLGLRKGEQDAELDSRRPFRLWSLHEIRHSQASPSPSARRLRLSSAFAESRS